MNPAVAERLLEINRLFYAEHGHDFSRTRQRLQPGVQRLVDTLSADESVLDLGCGNGEFARTLSRRSHHGPYVGVDFSPSLLEDARRHAYDMPTRFVQADLLKLAVQARPEWAASIDDALPAQSQSRAAVHAAARAGRWSIIAAFAVLHHIPSRPYRLELLGTVRSWLQADGRFFVSAWQFLGNQRMKMRIQPWSAAGLSAEELDSNDYLLDWRQGSVGVRYVHQFDEAEFHDLAASSGFVVAETFHADGRDRRSSLYQVWMPGPRSA